MQLDLDMWVARSIAALKKNLSYQCRIVRLPLKCLVPTFLFNCLDLRLSLSLSLRRFAVWMGQACQASFVLKPFSLSKNWVVGRREKSGNFLRKPGRLMWLCVRLHQAVSNLWTRQGHLLCWLSFICWLMVPGCLFLLFACVSCGNPAFLRFQTKCVGFGEPNPPPAPPPPPCKKIPERPKLDTTINHNSSGFGLLTLYHFSVWIDAQQIENCNVSKRRSVRFWIPRSGFLCSLRGKECLIPCSRWQSCGCQSVLSKVNFWDCFVWPPDRSVQMNNEDPRESRIHAQTHAFSNTLFCFLAQTSRK